MSARLACKKWSVVDGWVAGWVDGWVGGWMEVKAGLRIAYSNQKNFLGGCGLNIYLSNLLQMNFC